MISNVCIIYHMKVHMVSYDFDQKKISKSKIHILPIYQQTDLKTAIVRYLLKSCEARVTWHLLYLSSGKTVVTYTQRSYSSLEKQEVHLTICLWAIHKRWHQFLLTFSPLTPLSYHFLSQCSLNVSSIWGPFSTENWWRHLWMAPSMTSVAKKGFLREDVAAWSESLD